jgi:hypothetical protein
MGRINWTDHVRNEEVLQRVKEGRNILYTIKRRKGNSIGNILAYKLLSKTFYWGKYIRREKMKKTT